MQIQKIIKCVDLFYNKAYNKAENNIYWGKSGSGILYVCFEDKTILLLKRSSLVEQPGTWSVPGGAIGEGFYFTNHGEKISDTIIFLKSAEKEAEEELGTLPNVDAFLGITDFKDGDFVYKTFIYNLTLKEKKGWSNTISLNWENDDAKWFHIEDLPSNLHFGLQYMLNQKSDKIFPVAEESEEVF